jgi:hypothetical protein
MTNKPSFGLRVADNWHALVAYLESLSQAPETPKNEKEEASKKRART